MLRGRAEGKEEDMTLLHSEENVNIIDVTLLLKPRNEINFGINGLKKGSKINILLLIYLLLTEVYSENLTMKF